MLYLVRECWQRSAYLRPPFATGMTIAAWPADIWHDYYRQFGDWDAYFLEGDDNRE